MRIYTPAGDLAFKTFTFSDGQPHFKLETIDDGGFTEVSVETALRSTNDLLTLALVSSVLRANGFKVINLDIRYLLGARMDRAISVFEPFTLSVVAGIINSCGFNRVRILDAHSEAATRLIRNSENVLPQNAVDQAILAVTPNIIVSPDKGAFERTRALAGSRVVAQGSKVRNVATGELTGFKVERFTGRRALIIDDICDGGGTFSGLAKELRSGGADYIALFVTHGIFSKGLPIEGIDHVYTTDSYAEKMDGGYRHFHSLARGTVIPINMEKL